MQRPTRPQYRSAAGLARISILAAIALLAGACGSPFSLVEFVDGPDGVPLSVTPQSGTVVANSSVDLVAVGGFPPYTFELVSGSGTLSGNRYTAAITASMVLIRVSDRIGTTVDAEFVVDASGVPLAISPSVAAATSSPPTNTIAFQSVGGTGPTFTFSFANPGDNPSGATIDEATGVYTAGPLSGIDTITLTDDTAGTTVTATVNVTAGTFVPNVNYDVDPIVSLVSTSERFGGAFTAVSAVTNVGDVPGGSDLVWTVYASPDGAIDGPDDIIVDSGTIPGGLAAGESSPIAIAGNWPSIEANYFLIIQVAAGDEVPGVENIASSAGQTIVTRPLRLAPSSYTLSTGDQIAFAPDGLVGTDGWDLETDASGASVSPAGLYTAGNVAGTDVVRVTDSADGSTATATVTVQARPLSVSPLSVTATTDPPTNAITFEPVGGTGPTFTFSFANPGDNVSGATIDEATGVYTAGAIAGTDTVTMTDMFDLRTVTATVTVVEASVLLDVDYEVGPIINIASTNVSGQPLTADASVSNVGTAAGTADLRWTVYASTDAIIGGASDFIVDSGVILGGIPAGGSSPISMSGVWPSVQGDYWLIIDVSASDEVAGPENTDTSAATTSVITPVSISPLNFTVYPGQAIQFNAEGGGGPYTWDFDPVTPPPSGGSLDPVGLYTAGGTPATDVVRVNDASNGTWASADVEVVATPLPNAVNYQIDDITVTSAGTTIGDVLEGAVDISNTTTGSGGENIVWHLYASADTFLGPGDELLATGVEPFLGSTETRGILFSTVWPATPDGYYLIATIAADDETNAAGNQFVQMTPTTILAPPPADVDYVVGSVPTGGTRAPVTNIADLDDGVNDLDTFVIANQGTAAGSAGVTWTVYLSTDSAFNLGDTPVDTGTISALSSGGTSGTISIGGSWPDTGDPWPYYLIVRLTASDDIDSTNNTAASGVFHKEVAGADLTVTSITIDNPDDFVGAPVSESFVISNVGDTDSSAFTWNVYASDDATFGGDVLLESGVETGLAAGYSLPAESISATWPAAAATGLPTHIWVEIVPDVADAAPANDRVVAGPYSIVVPPDYSVIATPPVLHVVTEGGNTGELLSNVGTHEFTIEKVSGADGSKPVVWNAYLSRNPFFDGSEIFLGGGVEDPIVAPETSVTIPLPAPWALPADPGYGYWHIIVSVSASDDTNGSNDTYASPPISVWSLTGSGETDTLEDDISFAQADDFGVLLNPSDAIAINGIVDGIAGYRDSFVVKTGTSADLIGLDVTELRIRVEQFYTPGNPSTRNDPDLYLYEISSTAPVDSSIEVNPVQEPAAAIPGDSTTWFIVPVTPGETYTVDVIEVASNTPGVPYTLYIEAY